MGVEENSGGGKQTAAERSKRRQKRLSRVQILYETCTEVFADCGPHVVPSPEKLQKLASVMDGMTQEDVGLRPNLPFFSASRAATITYMHLIDCDKFSIGIFCLPPNSVIPLHNHPGMTVFSKLLFGTMHVTAYDWMNHTSGVVVDPKDHPDSGLKLAKLKVNEELTSQSKATILYPNDGGNMHRFTAKTACAMLDVLGPPYSDDDGRHCQYFYEMPFDKHPELASSNLSTFTELKKEDKEEYVWLGEREKPEELSLVGAPYTGPRISTKRKR